MVQAKPCLIAPDPHVVGLTRQVLGIDHLGAEISLNVVEERPLTIWLNGQEIVTAMTIGDYPEFLAQGFLSNQGMLSADEIVEAVDFDAELETVVVRTNTPTNYEAKLRKKTRTSGCAVGTVFDSIRCYPGKMVGPGVVFARNIAPVDAEIVPSNGIAEWREEPKNLRVVEP